MEITNLIGKYCYLSQPNLISNSEVFIKPVLVETITHGENIAGCIINGKYVVGYNWINTLLKTDTENNKTKMSIIHYIED